MNKTTHSNKGWGSLEAKDCAMDYRVGLRNCQWFKFCMTYIKIYCWRFCFIGDHSVDLLWKGRTVLHIFHLTADCFNFVFPVMCLFMKMSQLFNKCHSHEDIFKPCVVFSVSFLICLSEHVHSHSDVKKVSCLLKCLVHFYHLLSFL